MKLLFDFLPVIIFFLIYKLFNHNIYIATSSVIIVSLLQVGGYWLKYRKFKSVLVTNCLLIVIFGGTTLLLHQEIYVKWKVTALYWLYAAALLISQWFFEKPLIQRLLEDNIALPLQIWQRVNLFCVGFFTLLGGLNLYIVYHFSTNTWVNFKLFGILGLTVAFFIGLSIYLAQHLPQETGENK